MTLNQLRAELALIHAHDLTPTNVLSVEHAAGEVVCATDTSDLAEQLADAVEEKTNLEAELKATEEDRDRLDAENEKLTEMHLEFADKESGVTPLTYRQQAEEAEKARQLFRDAMNAANAERDALRKRKGVTCELFKNQRDIESFLGACASRQLTPDDAVKLATELRIKLYTT